MILITPSILSSDFGGFRATVEEFQHAGADAIHFDVMDGQFVPPITFGAQLVHDLATSDHLPFEAHLMTLTPERHFSAFRDSGCERVIFHLEATSHAHRLCQELRAMGVQAGVALNPGTPVELVWPVLEVADWILVMTVNPGWGGQQFIRETLTKIEVIRARTDLPIQVDGGIDSSTIRAAFDAGATAFVAGSFLAHAPDKQAAIAALRSACAG